MATTKKDDGTKAAEGSIDQVQQAFDKAQAQGFFGTKVDPLPNSAHSLESGPDAPPVLEQHATVLDQRSQAVRDSSGGES